MSKCNTIFLIMLYRFSQKRLQNSLYSLKSKNNSAIYSEDLFYLDLEKSTSLFYKSI